MMENEYISEREKKLQNNTKKKRKFRHANFTRISQVKKTKNVIKASCTVDTYKYKREEYLKLATFPMSPKMFINFD